MTNHTEYWFRTFPNPNVSSIKISSNEDSINLSTPPSYLMHSHLSIKITSCCDTSLLAGIDRARLIPLSIIIFTTGKKHTNAPPPECVYPLLNCQSGYCTSALWWSYLPTYSVEIRKVNTNCTARCMYLRQIPSDWTYRADRLVYVERLVRFGGVLVVRI